MIKCQKIKLTLYYYLKRNESINDNESSDEDVQVISKTNDETDCRVISPWKLAVL